MGRTGKKGKGTREKKENRYVCNEWHWGERERRENERERRKRTDMCVMSGIGE
jgi:hypothetical protein